MKKLRDSMTDDQIREMINSVLEVIDFSGHGQFNNGINGFEDQEKIALIQAIKDRLFVNAEDCYLCRQRGKNWDGGEPKCAFSGNFHDNWRCATLNALRRIADLQQNCDPIPEVDYRYCDDQKYATICLDGMGHQGQYVGDALWISWYKSRGKTDNVVLLDSDDLPRIPTEDECLRILRFFHEKGVDIGIALP